MPPALSGFIAEAHARVLRTAYIASVREDADVTPDMTLRRVT